MPSRIGTEALFNSQLSYLQRIQTRQYMTDEQISTGFKSQTFAGVASDAGTIISSSAMMQKIDQYNRNITIAGNRMKLMDSSLSAIDKSISSLNSYLAQLSDATNPPDVPRLAKDLLNQVTDFLNVNDGERYLFAGSGVSTAPVRTLSAGSGVAPTVAAVPTSLNRVASALPLPSGGAFPAANYDAATNTFFRPNPDNPELLQSYKQNLPPLTTLELSRNSTTAVTLEVGQVIEGTNGARGRIVSLTAGGANTSRLYIEPINDIPFTANGDYTVKQLTQVGSNYVETTPPTGTAASTFKAIGGLSSSNIDTQSIQLNAALPSNIVPGSLIQIAGGTGARYIVSSIEQPTTTGTTPVLKVRLISGTADSAGSPGAGAGRQIDLVNPQTGALITGVAQIQTSAGAAGVEAIGPAPDYQTNNNAVGGTGYYTNQQAAREILNPQKVQVTDNSTVDYGITADKAGFSRLIYTLNFLQQQSSPLNKDDVAAANKILVEARTQITSLRASAGINQKTLLGIEEQNKLQKSIANNNFDFLAKQDKTEAIATLTSLQTILEASYNSYSRIQSLNLQSFLR
jgi:flagellin-like hook-associated protein FlgL